MTKILFLRALCTKLRSERHTVLMRSPHKMWERDTERLSVLSMPKKCEQDTETSRFMNLSTASFDSIGAGA